MDTGHAAWVLTSASLVLLMTPGLALFYGGMTRSKSILNMMMMSFGAMGVISIVYILWGYSMSYSSITPNVEGEVAGEAIGVFFSDPFALFGLSGIDPSAYLSVAFQLTFAVLTAALISGAIADRVRFSTWMIFIPIWITFSYFPLAHQIWGGGFLSQNPSGLAAMIFGTVGEGAAAVAEVAPLDYAGGTVVHINAGVAGLVLALVIGARKGFGTDPMKPHSLPLTMIGAGLLWFGWFGFNVGSFVPSAEGTGDAFAANFAGETGLVWINTTAAAAAAMLGWLLIEKIRDGKGTSLGAASGVVAGLVAITPACGALSPVGSLLLGVIAGGAAALAVGLKRTFGYDDSLDVVGVHLVAGIIGTIGIGFLATTGGLLYGDGVKQLVVQAAVALVAILWSAVITLILALAIKHTIGWRITEDEELEGIDFVEHGESAYDFAGLSGRGGALGRVRLSAKSPVEEGAPA